MTQMFDQSMSMLTTTTKQFQIHRIIYIVGERIQNIHTRMTHLKQIVIYQLPVMSENSSMSINPKKPIPQLEHPFSYSYYSSEHHFFLFSLFPGPRGFGLRKIQLAHTLTSFW